MPWLSFSDQSLCLLGRPFCQSRVLLDLDNKGLPTRVLTSVSNSLMTLNPSSEDLSPDSTASSIDLTVFLWASNLVSTSATLLIV